MGQDWSQVRLPDATFGIDQRLEFLDTGWQTFTGHYLLYASSGTFTLEVENRRWLLPPHRAAWVAADEPIRLQAKSPVTCSSILFYKGTISPLTFNCRVFSISTLAREMILYSMQWGIGRDPQDSQADRFFVALADVCADLALRPESFWLPRARSEELVCAMDYILEHLPTSLQTDEIANVVNISKRTLARRFVEEAHMTCGQFIHRARMLLAMELLSENASAIIDVAYRVGFESLSAFNTAFRNFTQETPSQYRKRFLSR